MKNSETYNDLANEWDNSQSSIVVKTSGSTGTPKLMTLSKELMISSAQRTIDYFKLKKGHNLHSCISAAYIGGKMIWLRSKLCDGNFTHENPSNNPIFPTTGKRYSLIAMVASQVDGLINILSVDYDYSRFGNIIIGGGKISDKTRKKILATNMTAFETYGMTETASHIAIRPITETELHFHPLPGIILSKDSKDCLVIKLNNPEITVVTNDIVELNNDSSFQIIGRADDVIISGGCKINPAEVENILDECFNRPFITVGEDDEKWGQRLVIFTEDENFNKELLERKLKLLPSYMRPKEVKRVESLPRTENGKLIRTRRKI